MIVLDYKCFVVIQNLGYIESLACLVIYWIVSASGLKPAVFETAYNMAIGTEGDRIVKSV